MVKGKKVAEGRPKIAIERPGRQLRPAQCRTWVKSTLAKHLPEVVEAFLADRSSASCTHLQLVVELLEMGARARGKKRDVGPKLKALLAHWREEKKALSQGEEVESKEG